MAANMPKMAIAIRIAVGIAMMQAITTAKRRQKRSVGCGASGAEEALAPKADLTSSRASTMSAQMPMGKLTRLQATMERMPAATAQV